MRSLIPFIVLLVGGCNTTPRSTEVIEVDKPIAINCIKQRPARPMYQTERMGQGSTDLEYADALANDWALSRVYEQKMEAAVDACTTP